MLVLSRATVDSHIAELHKATNELRTLVDMDPDGLSPHVGDLLKVKLDLDEILEKIDREVFPFIEFPRT